MCHGHVASSSTVPPAALTCSVALTVSDGVDNEEGVTEGENDDYEVIRKEGPRLKHRPKNLRAL